MAIGRQITRLNRELIGKAEAIHWHYRAVLDMDSTEIPVYGEQEQSAYNGHFESMCYHPLLLFNRDGDCLAAKLRPGSVHSAEDWEELLLPEIERQQRMEKEVVFRADAAFAQPEVYESSEQRGVQYAIRMAANKSLELEIEDILFCPPGRSSRKPLVRYKSFRYQAESWARPRRIVAKVEHHPGELFARPGFEVRLQLSVLAYNLGNLWRRLVLPQRIEKWSLTSLQQRLVKTGGRLVKHARYYWLLLAEGHLTRRLFASMLGRIDGLALPSG